MHKTVHEAEVVLLPPVRNVPLAQSCFLLLLPFLFPFLRSWGSLGRATGREPGVGPGAISKSQYAEELKVSDDEQQGSCTARHRFTQVIREIPITVTQLVVS